MKTGDQRTWPNHQEIVEVPEFTPVAIASTHLNLNIATGNTREDTFCQPRLSLVEIVNVIKTNVGGRFDSLISTFNIIPVRSAEVNFLVTILFTSIGNCAIQVQKIPQGKI